MSAVVTTLPPGEHLDVLLKAIEVEGEAQRLLLDGDWDRGRSRMNDASALYRTSWELAPPRSFGRLVGMLKSAIIGGTGAEAARYAFTQGPDLETPTAAYAAAIIALVDGDETRAQECAVAMRSASAAFARAADAIDAMVGRDRAAYSQSITAIVRDFESREAHLTGVAIADTAVMFEELSRSRGLAGGVKSGLLPPAA